MDDMEATGKGLIEFLEEAGRSGRMTKSWAQALRSACRSLLVTVAKDDWETLDLAEANLDDLHRRFKELRSDLTDGSLYTYGRRLHIAVTAYLDYLQDPDGWQPEDAGRPPEGSLVTYPYPLRPSLMLSLSLPPDLTAEEADRLAAFLHAVSVK